MGVAATEVASGTWKSSDINYVFDSDGTLTINGSGVLKYNKNFLDSYKYKINKVVI